MKTLRILLFLLITVAATNAQTIPNAGFESWYSYSLGEYPTGWMTSDSVAKALAGVNNVYKDINSYEGSFAMHLMSIDAGLVKGPGVATNGTISQVGLSFVFSGGSPDTTRPRYLVG